MPCLPVPDELIVGVGHAGGLRHAGADDIARFIDPRLETDADIRDSRRRPMVSRVVRGIVHRMEGLVLIADRAVR